MNIIDVNRRRETHDSRDINNNRDSNNNVGISRESDTYRDARDGICMDDYNSKSFFQKFAAIVLNFYHIHSYTHIPNTPSTSC
jgi:hypothetical protein